MNIEDLPKKIPVFPLSNFIIFPKTTVPLNIFEPRYIDMINDSMKSNKLIGMIQPKIQKKFYDNWMAIKAVDHKKLEENLKAKPHQIINLDDISTNTDINNNEILTNLKSLDELYKSGSLTKEEFEKAKKKILN